MSDSYIRLCYISSAWGTLLPASEYLRYVVVIAFCLGGHEMIFLTSEQCKEYCSNFGLESPINSAGSNGIFCCTVRYPTEAYRYYSLSQLLAAHCLSPLNAFNECLLWVANPMIFGSSNNLHLYYRLRQSYGDLRLLQDAPGHCFLGHEQCDLATFTHLGMLFGWDMHLVPREETSAFPFRITSAWTSESETETALKKY